LRIALDLAHGAVEAVDQYTQVWLAADVFSKVWVAGPSMTAVAAATVRCVWASVSVAAVATVRKSPTSVFRSSPAPVIAVFADTLTEPNSLEAVSNAAAASDTSFSVAEASLTRPLSPASCVVSVSILWIEVVMEGDVLVGQDLVDPIESEVRAPERLRAAGNDLVDQRALRLDDRHWLTRLAFERAGRCPR
jgi:hypothetical protein